MVKHGTPDHIVVRLNGVINKALAAPRVQDSIARLSAETAGGSPAEFSAHVTAQVKYWAKVVRDSGMTMHQ